MHPEELRDLNTAAGKNCSWFRRRASARRA
jgi:hypothetical protein